MTGPLNYMPFKEGTLPGSWITQAPLHENWKYKKENSNNNNRIST